MSQPVTSRPSEQTPVTTSTTASPATRDQLATGEGQISVADGVVQKIAEREHFVMVLERNSSVVYGQPSLDITNEVIRTYNSGAPKK